MKRILIYLSCFATFLALIFFLLGFYTNAKEDSILQKNEIEQGKAKVSVVTFGERITDSEIYFVQWESLSKKEREQALNQYNIFLFSSDEFTQNKYNDLIKKITENNKTVLFYGYQMNVKDLIGEKSEWIPYYEVRSNKNIYYYLYGYGYSAEHNRMLPITIIGNFSRDKMNYHIASYIKKTYATF